MQGILALLLIMSIGFSGCSFLRYVDGSTEEELEAFCTGKPVEKKNVFGETRAQEQRKLEYELRAEERLRGEIAKREQELEEQKTHKAQLAAEYERLVKTVTVLQEEAKTKQPSVAALTEGEQPTAPAIAAASNKSTGIRIKVLSGNGKIASARKMAKMVKSLGYDVVRVGIASSTRYSRDTLFFANEFKDVAASMSKYIKKGMVIKPLTWKSPFDIVIVTRNEKFK